MPFLVPGGEALWLASNSCSVIGRGTQNLPFEQICHGELVDVSVTGAQEVVVAAAVEYAALLANLLSDWKSLTAMVLHGATVAVATGSELLSAPSSTATAD